MASNKRIPALNVKIKEYKRAEDGKGIDLLTHEDLLKDKYAYLQLNDPKYYKENSLNFYAKTCLSSIDSKGNKWLIGSMNKGALNNLFNLNFTKDNKPDVTAESKWIDEWVSNGCLFILCVNANPTLSHVVDKTQGYLFELSENTTLPFSSKNDELISQIDDAIAYQIEHQDVKEEYYESTNAIPAFFFNAEELKRLRIKHTPEYEGDFPDKLVPTVQLPEVEDKGNRKGSNKGGGTYNNYMSTQERLESVLELLEGKNAEKFDLLYAHYTDNPSRTAFALALTGLTIHQKSASNAEVESHSPSNGFKESPEIEVKTRAEKEPAKKRKSSKSENGDNATTTDSTVDSSEDDESSYPHASKFFREYPSEVATNISDDAKQALSELAANNLSEETEAYLDLLSKLLSFPVQNKTYPAREVKRILNAHGYNSPILCYNFDELETIADKLGVIDKVLS